MKLQKDSSIANNKNLSSNNTLKLHQNKFNNLKEIKNSNNILETKRESVEKNEFNSGISFKHNKIHKIKSSIFDNNRKSSNDKTNHNNNTHNKTKSMDEKSDYFSNNNKEKTIKNQITNFSSSFSSKTNFPDLKSTERNSHLSSSSNNNFALTFFKLSKKKNAISLKKDTYCEKINNIDYLSIEKINDAVPLKYPKKPILDYGNISIRSRSNLNVANNLMKVNQSNNSNNKTNLKNLNKDLETSGHIYKNKSLKGSNPPLSHNSDIKISRPNIRSGDNIRKIKKPKLKDETVEMIK